MKLERLYPWLLLAPVFLPFVVWSGVLYPYLVPKVLLFYAVMFLSVGVFSILVVRRHAFYWGRLTQKVVWIPALLLALAYGTSYFGTDFYRSFWSLFIRGDGLLMLTCLVSSFYLILLYADGKFFERLLRVSAIVGSIVALYGIGEWFVRDGRVGGLLGNAAFFAGYLGLTFFATLASTQVFSTSVRRFVYFGALLQLIAIALSATRGTILALLLSGLLYLLYVAITKKGSERTWSVGALATLLILGGTFFIFRAELSQVSFEPVARLASISLTDTTVASRLFIWENTLEAIQQNPWQGVGAEHINTLFDRFYDPTQIKEQWFDRSHNAFLDYAVQYGIGGLVLYLALIASFVIPVRRWLARGEKHFAVMFSLLVITYVGQNFFVFDTVSSLWLLLALLATALSVVSQKERSSLVVPEWTRIAVWPFFALLILLLIPVSIRPAYAAYYLAHAYTYQLSDVTKEVKYLSRGTALGTYGDMEYGYIAYDMYVHQQIDFLSGSALDDAYQATLSLLRTNFDQYSYDARTAVYLAHVLTSAPPTATVDAELLSSALARAIQLSPKRAQSWYILANLSIGRANAYPPRSSERMAGYAAARDILSQYIELVPTLSAPHYVLAQLLYASGDKKGAAVEAEKGRVVYVSDLETARRAVVYYETVLDLANAEYFLKEVLRHDPHDAGAQSDLEQIQAYAKSR